MPKENLWQQDSEGNWRIDPERDALRMANHTRVYHTRPSRDVLLEAVTRQFHSGEGAIQFAPEALARSNADLLSTQELRSEFIEIYCDQGRQEAGRWLQQNHGPISEEELEHRLSRYGLNPCGEILGADFHCNLAEVHLNQIDPKDEDSQRDAFRAGALSVACLLNHNFEVERYRQSRAWDPIVGVSFTGLFDFFVHAFGTPWLQWWEAGRPETEEGLNYKKQEAEYLKRWKSIVNETVWDYCERHGLRVQTAAPQFSQPAQKACSQELHLDGIPPKLNALSAGSHFAKMILLRWPAWIMATPLFHLSRIRMIKVAF